MTMKKIAYLFSIAALALTLGACSEDEPNFNPAPAVEDLPVFFSYEKTTEIEIFESTTGVEVPVYRKSAEGALSVPVTATVTPDADGFSFPGTIEFADGETQATYTVDLDVSKIQGRVDYKMTLTIGDGVDTPYFTDNITYTLNYSPWVTVVGTDKDGNEVTKALFRDDIIATLYGLDAVEYEVEMQANPENTNIIRLVDPYGEAWPYAQYGDYDDSEHHYMYFNITNPNEVFLCDKNGVALGTDGSDITYHTGLTLDEDGEILITTYYNYMVGNGKTPDAEMYGTLKQGNLTFGVKMVLLGFANSTSLYYANTNGQFRIIWPGAEPYVDPMTIWNPIGKGKFTDGILYPLAIMEDENEELPTYEVEVMQYAGDPALYRIMNPWKAGVCPYGVDYSGDLYIELDTTDPDCVVMPQQSTGLTFGANGTLYIMNYGYYVLASGGTAADVIEQGVNDTFKDGVIYSAPGNLLWGFPVNGKLNLRRGSFEWQLVMPDASSEGTTAKTASTGYQFGGNGPLMLTERARSARSGWDSIQPVFSTLKKTLK